MDRKALSELLHAAPTQAERVAIVARYFAAHPLFYGHGTDNPDDEAFWLVWELTGRPESLDDASLEAADADAIARLAERRVVERVPLAYLLGSAWFAGLDFAVSRDVLIPRSPLAELVERGFAPWIELADGDRVLEIGTGSGCIAIALAVLHPGLRVDATEIHAPALEVARANVAHHDVGDRCQLIESDLFPGGDARYRVIISNPPYVPAPMIGSLPEEYGHEPEAALDGGEDGLDVVRRILEGAGQRLEPDGILIVEVGVAAEALADAYPKVPWTWLGFERGGDGVFLLTAEDLRDGWG